MGVAKQVGLRPTVFILAILILFRNTGGGALSRAAGQTSTKKLSSLEAEVISLLPAGFLPSAISRRAGPFLLIIRNYDHTADLNFDAAPADIGILPGTIFKEQETWSGLVILPSGDHLLKDHSKPARQLKITMK